MIVENKLGFLFNGKQIYFIDGQGKDISFDRWRVSLYYEPGFAETHFLPSQIEYDDFMEKYQPCCYDNYIAWRDESKKLDL
uniref:Uncharacterized protein n=1 Tax=viral metagenome TaxID=1070528 RepID=A0A6M3J560_9ZZZZ